MTEDEFHNLPLFENLPLFSYKSPRSQTLKGIPPLNSSYLSVMECNEYEDALRALKKDRFEPRGTIRFQTGTRDIPEVVVNYIVYFWEKQMD